MAATRSRLDVGRVTILVVCLVAGTLLWDYPVVLPLKLLVVAMHETGHALASLLVGGSVDRITLASNESGACLSRLPQGVFRQIFVYSAGYLGSAVAGALLLLATYRLRLRRAVLGGLSVWLAVIGLLYGRDPFTLCFCFGAAVALGLAARFLPPGAVDAVNLFLAAFSSLYAVIDLRDDLWNSAVRSQSDAALLAGVTYVPSVVWAALWTLGSLAILGLFAWGALRRSAPEPAMRATLPVAPGRL
jgi:hypothetical protein